MTLRILVLAYGNPGRLDDGLGPALVARLEAAALPGVTLEADYQLRLEDASLVAEHDAVVFVDAASSGPAPFDLERTCAEPGRRFTTHSVPPGALLHVAETCFGRAVPAWTLAIRGCEFDGFGERLSEAASANLDASVAFLGRVLEQAAETGILDVAMPDRPVMTSEGTHHA